MDGNGGMGLLLLVIMDHSLVPCVKRTSKKMIFGFVSFSKGRPWDLGASETSGVKDAIFGIAMEVSGVSLTPILQHLGAGICGRVWDIFKGWKESRFNGDDNDDELWEIFVDDVDVKRRIGMFNL